MPVLQRAKLRMIERAEKPDDRRKIRERRYLELESLGSGSDFTPFLQHVGLASLHVGYGGESDGGIYHSIYDDFTWYTRFADTDFSYSRTLAQTAGLITLRLANADLLPMDFMGSSEAIARFVQEIGELADRKRQETEEWNLRIEENLPWAVADPKKPFVAPKPRVVPPHFDFSPLQNASDALTAAAAAYARAYDAAFAPGAARLAPERLAAVNRAIAEYERSLTGDPGLPGRPWYRHYVYAPGAYTGYGVKTLPAVREALEERRWNDVNTNAETTAKVILAGAAQIQQATKLLGP
jgi:N-acetylated-alpha-linked acidic dipeptidase